MILPIVMDKNKPRAYSQSLLSFAPFLFSKDCNIFNMKTCGRNCRHETTICSVHCVRKSRRCALMMWTHNLACRGTFQKLSLRGKDNLSSLRHERSLWSRCFVLLAILSNGAGHVNVAREMIDAVFSPSTGRPLRYTFGRRGIVVESTKIRTDAPSWPQNKPKSRLLITAGLSRNSTNSVPRTADNTSVVSSKCNEHAKIKLKARSLKKYNEWPIKNSLKKT